MGSRLCIIFSSSHWLNVICSLIGRNKDGSQSLCQTKYSERWMQKNLRKQSNVVFHGEVHGVDHGVVRHNAWFKFWGGVFHDQNWYWCTVSRLINAHCTSTVSGHARSSGPELQQQDWACLACFQKHIFVINIWWIYWISCHTLIDSRFVFGTSSPLLQCILVLSPVSLVRGSE